MTSLQRAVVFRFVMLLLSFRNKCTVFRGRSSQQFVYLTRGEELLHMAFLSRKFGDHHKPMFNSSVPLVRGECEVDVIYVISRAEPKQHLGKD
jgi:hypothetical protein